MDFKNTEWIGSKVVQCIADEVHTGKSPNGYNEQMRREMSLSLTNTT